MEFIGLHTVCADIECWYCRFLKCSLWPNSHTVWLLLCTLVLVYLVHYTDEGIDRRFKEALLQHLSVYEYNCLMQTSAASDYDDLSLFVR